MGNNTNKSDFRFEGYRIYRSSINVKEEGSPDEGYEINIAPSGLKNKDKFDLTLDINIKDKKEIVDISMSVVGTFYFREDIDIKLLPTFFAINAPAILFPYVRAYISLLSSLSGIDAILLPTLNLSSLGEELLQNIKEQK